MPELAMEETEDMLADEKMAIRGLSAVIGRT